MPNYALFPQLEELTICIGNEWPLGSLRVLSTLIHLSHLTKLSLVFSNSSCFYPGSTVNIEKLLELTCNIRSLKILFRYYYWQVPDRNIQICTVVPNYVKHVTLSVSRMDQMYKALHQLKYRSSITFEYVSTADNAPDMHLEWLERERGYYTYRLNTSSLCMWFDKYTADFQHIHRTN